MRRINKISNLTMTLIILMKNRITIIRIKISVWLSRNRSSRPRLNHLLNLILKSIYFSVLIRLNRRRRLHQTRINAIPWPVNHKKRQHNQQTKNTKETRFLHFQTNLQLFIIITITKINLSPKRVMNSPIRRRKNDPSI